MLKMTYLKLIFAMFTGDILGRLWVVGGNLLNCLLAT